MKMNKKERYRLIAIQIQEREEGICFRICYGIQRNPIAEIQLLLTENQEIDQTVVKEIWKGCHIIDPKQEVGKIIMTGEETKQVKQFVKQMRQMLLEAGVLQEAILWLSKEQSGCYYAMWHHPLEETEKVAFFDCFGEQVFYHTMQQCKQQQICYVWIRKESLDPEESLSREWIAEKKIAILYFIMSSDLLERQRAFLEDLAYCCRIWAGENLYLQGAYEAAVQMQQSKQQQWFFLGAQQSCVTVKMKVLQKGVEKKYVLVSLGEPLQEREIDVIFQQQSKIALYVSGFLFAKEQLLEICLDDLEMGKVKRTRIRLSVRFKTQTCMELTIRDLGFGDFFRGSAKVWKKTIDFECGR